MRLNYTDDEDYPGQFNIWHANCRRSLRGKKGQAALRRLEAALLALPSKRLIREELTTIDTVRGRQDVCAIGALALMEGREDVLYGDAEVEAAGQALGMPHLVAWKVVEQNDIQLDTVWERAYGPVKPYEATYQGGIAVIREMTPEERYERMLAWVQAELRPSGLTPAS